MPLIRRGPDRPAPPAGTTLDQAVAGLSRGTADERWQAARDLPAIEGGLSVLADALFTERDPRVRDAIFTGLARFGGEAGVDAMIRALRSDDANLRSGAVDALRAIAGAAAARLPALLADGDADVRLLACELARELPSADASDLLAALLDREAETNVCASAVEVLAEIGDVQALPALERCAARFPDQPFLRFAIAAAVRRIGSGRPARGG